MRLVYANIILIDEKDLVLAKRFIIGKEEIKKMTFSMTRSLRKNKSKDINAEKKIRIAFSRPI